METSWRRLCSWEVYIWEAGAGELLRVSCLLCIPKWMEGGLTAGGCGDPGRVLWWRSENRTRGRRGISGALHNFLSLFGRFRISYGTWVSTKSFSFQLYG